LWFWRPSWNDFCWQKIEVRERRHDRHERFSDMVIKILLLTILMGAIAAGAHLPDWTGMAKRKNS
jgi:hypothetical protein